MTDSAELTGYNTQEKEFYTITPQSSYLPPSREKTSYLSQTLQTLSVLYHVLTIYPILPGLLLSFYALHQPLQTALLILLSLLLQTARSTLLRSLSLWNYYVSYFPLTLYRSTPLPKSKKYIFGYHPHGILAHGAFASFATEALGFSHLFPGIHNTLLTLDSSFRIPLYRDYLLAMGLASVSRSSCLSLLSTGGTDGHGTGNAVTIVLGGARESLEALPGSMTLVLRNRKGFIRLAIETGADIVPVLAFGENELYEMVEWKEKSWGWRVQMWFKRVCGFTLPFLYVRGAFGWDCGFMPKRRAVSVVVGRPIGTGKDGGDVKSGEEWVDELHRRYVGELKRIWEEWRGVFGDGEGEMRIVG